MPVVTKVTQQKRPGRYNIYLDDEFAIAVDENILIRFDLFKGTEVSDTMLAEVQAAEYEQKAYATGLLYATGQLRSRYQVYLKLREKEFPIDVINHALDRLEKAHVLDDRQFASTYLASVSHSGKLGRKGALQKLKEWGISDDIVQDVADEYDDSDELEHLDELVAKLMHKYQRQAHRMAEQKVMQNLLQKGFASRNIQQALHHYVLENDTADEPDQEWENLSRDGEKAFQRYHQYTGWDLERRVKGYLARRGYTFDLINRFVDDYQKNI
ncbi:RecX family transcriptional regulator [Weissella viridescens]|uniref:RecX family transcriptional regulator n=1 Tax=Weissella viridescens TaxID=1629 RepID=UPI001747A276|nr:RecX family transcriptional regulator [Weissella viridescens]MCB6840044.1 RecX family transcriptional regulator [Weissella viridescens]MCB6846722.1 RecX family transcriptional regulator [Weissella viridescens]QOD86449.1 RecX family transcriptional regulator [Weissella viridescens]WJI91581.1 RecX family transcriptional regulator [Weissella viridescens]